MEGRMWGVAMTKSNPAARSAFSIATPSALVGAPSSIDAIQ
jgi:hypothetical protein